MTYNVFTYSVNFVLIYDRIVGSITLLNILEIYWNIFPA